MRFEQWKQVHEQQIRVDTVGRSLVVNSMEIIDEYEIPVGLPDAQQLAHKDLSGRMTLKKLCR
jgi:hypothetical protein